MVIVDVLYSYVWDVKSSKVKQKQKLHTKDNISAFFYHSRVVLIHKNAIC